MKEKYHYITKRIGVKILIYIFILHCLHTHTHVCIYIYIIYICVFLQINSSYTYIHIVSSITSFVLIHRDTVGLIGEDFSAGLWEMHIFTWISTIKHYLKNKTIYH